MERICCPSMTGYSLPVAKVPFAEAQPGQFGPLHRHPLAGLDRVDEELRHRPHLHQFSTSPPSTPGRGQPQGHSTGSSHGAKPGEPRLGQQRRRTWERAGRPGHDQHAAGRDRPLDGASRGRQLLPATDSPPLSFYSHSGRRRERSLPVHPPSDPEVPRKPPQDTVALSFPRSKYMLGSLPPPLRHTPKITRSLSPET